MKTKKLILVLGVILVALSCTKDGDEVFDASGVEEQQSQTIETKRKGFADFTQNRPNRPNRRFNLSGCNKAYLQVTITYTGGSSDLNERLIEIDRIRADRREKYQQTPENPCPKFVITYRTFPRYNSNLDLYTENWYMFDGKPEGSTLSIDVGSDEGPE